MDKQSKIAIAIVGAGLASALIFFHSKSPTNPLSSALEISQEANVGNKTESAITAAPAVEISKVDQSLLQSFEEILKSKNDNDPRIDSEFRHLSASMKQALYKRYQAFPREDRNGRGLVVFLVSRELNSVDDIHFLQSIYEEAPCTNMDGCSAAPSNDPHHSGVENTSLNYPQLVGLYQIEKALKNNPQAFADPTEQAALLVLISKAKSFPVQSVQNRAASIASLIPPH